MRVPARDLLVLAGIVVLGLVLRVRDVTAFRASPDEGNYMHSARLHVIGTEGGPGRWIQQDVAWAKELARDFSRAEHKTTYPHSYLEQWIARWNFRLGAGYLAAFRLISALLGALLPVALYAAARARGRAGDDEATSVRLRRTGLVAAAIGSVLPVFVWYSRTGWGQIGCTFFYVVYFALGWRLFDPERTLSRKALVRIGLGMALTTLCAYGFHEMIVVHVAGLGLLALAAPAWIRSPADQGYVARFLKSPRTWTVVLSALPCFALLLALALLNPWAQETWLDAEMAADFGTRMRLAPAFLFERTRIQVQITWPVLVLAAVGAFVVARRSRSYAVYAGISAAASVLPLYLLYNFPHLVRIYLPTITIVVLFAADGLVAVRERLAPAWAWLRVADVLALVLYLACVTWISLFGRMDHPLAVSEFYWTRGEPLLESRHSEDPMFDHLSRTLEPEEVVGVVSAWEPLFILRDHGFASRMFSLAEPPERWPRFVIAIHRGFEGQMNAAYGSASEHPYTRVVAEHADRLALFERRP